MSNFLDRKSWNVMEIVRFVCICLFTLLSYSCLYETASIPVSPPVSSGEGFLTIQATYNDNPIHTRSDGGQSGTEEESRFNSALFILYDALTGQAVVVHSYTLAEDGTVLTATDATDHLMVTTAPDGSVSMRKVFTGLALTDYYLAVILNAHNLSAIYTNDTGNEHLMELLSATGHDISVLEQPLELTHYEKGKAWVEQGIGRALTGMELLFPGNLDVTEQVNRDKMKVVMSNADGFIRINATDIAGPEEEFGQSPVSVKLERAVAKVALFQDLDPDNLSHVAQVRDLSWTCDLLNNYMYLPRRLASTAPSAGGTQEQKTTTPMHRYAIDPNYDDYSNDRTGQQTTDLHEQFYRLADFPADELQQVFYKTWNTVSPEASATDWETWEYVTENTMAAAEQFEDVTTRIVIQCNYIPGTGNTITGSDIQEGESYYVYNGLAISHSQMMLLYDDPSSVPVNEYPRLNGLAVLLTDTDVINTFGWPGSPTESKAAKGISFYKDGVNYYRVLIRHFDDTLSPQLMGYGRYGVVRNNVYKVRINDITGPGSIKIPDPDGPDDKEDPVKSEIAVSPWLSCDLVFDL